MSYNADRISFELPPTMHIPAYLEKTYWWAYVHPVAVRLFERQWLVNAILWGNFAKLRDAALNELGQNIVGRTLQVACVYGDFSQRLAARIAAGGSLDIVDVLPIQLDNLRKKLSAGARVTRVPEWELRVRVPRLPAVGDQGLAQFGRHGFAAAQHAHAFLVAPAGR